MRSTATMLVLTSFIALAVFGVFGMASEKHHTTGFNACVGSLTQGVTCPSNNPIASSIFHLNSFRAFLNSPLASSAVLLAVIAGLMFAAASFSFAPPNFTLPFNAKTIVLNKIFETSCQPFKKERISWNSLHENSPSNAATSFRLPATG